MPCFWRKILVFFTSLSSCCILLSLSSNPFKSSSTWCRFHLKISSFKVNSLFSVSSMTKNIVRCQSQKNLFFQSEVLPLQFPLSPLSRCVFFQRNKLRARVSLRCCWILSFLSAHLLERNRWNFAKICQKSFSNVQRCPPAVGFLSVAAALFSPRAHLDWRSGGCFGPTKIMWMTQLAQMMTWMMMTSWQ